MVCSRWFYQAASRFKLPTPPIETIEPVTGLEENGEEAVTHALGEEEQVIATNDPQTLVDRARSVPRNEAIPLLLLAIDGFLEAKDFATAQILANQLSFYPLTNDDRIALQLRRAKMSQKMDRHSQALDQLRQIDALFLRPVIDPKQIALRGQHLLLIAKSQSALGAAPEALLALLERDELLLGDQQLENQKQIVSLMLSMDSASLSNLNQRSNNAHLPGWATMADILGKTAQDQLPGRLEQWRSLFPDHPVQLALLQQYTNIGQFEKYRQIALLLPLNSPFGSAARAFIRWL